MQPTECKKKRVVTEKMIQANRANAKKSTGPKTAVGKEKSRRNSLKHGMCSKTDILPTELDAKVQDRYSKWSDQLRPEGFVEATLIKRAVSCDVKLDWLDQQFHLIVAKQTREAGNRFDTREHKAALLEAESLDADPQETVANLRQSVAGCDWLIEEWKTLQDSLSDGLSNPQIARAFRLMGIDPSGELSEEQSSIQSLLIGTQTDADSSREMVHNLIQSTIDKTIQLRDQENAPLHGELRGQSQASSMLPKGKNGAIWPRYQGIHSKGFHQALHDLIKIRKLDNPPRPDDFRRDPTKDRAPNEPVRDDFSSQFASSPSDFRAALELETAKKDAEIQKLVKKVELLETQNRVKDTLIRVLERDGSRAPNEPVRSVETTEKQPNSLNRSAVLNCVIQAAAFLICFLLGNRAVASADRSADSRFHDETVRATLGSASRNGGTASATEVRAEVDGLSAVGANSQAGLGANDRRGRLAGS